jgi:hypothetical protein
LLIDHKVRVDVNDNESQHDQMHVCLHKKTNVYTSHDTAHGLLNCRCHLHSAGGRIPKPFCIVTFFRLNTNKQKDFLWDKLPNLGGASSHTSLVYTFVKL